MTGPRNQNKNSKPDWDAVEADYRTGRHSNRTLASKHGVSEFAIRSRAKRFDWQKDLTEQVATRARAIAHRAAHRTKSENPSQCDADLSDAELVEAAARETADVILQHRSDLAQLRAAELRLLEAAATFPLTATSLPDAARVHRSLTLARVSRIALERKAWGISEAAPSGGPDLGELSDEQLAQLEAVLAGPQ